MEIYNGNWMVHQDFKLEKGSFLFDSKITNNELICYVSSTDAKNRSGQQNTKILTITLFSPQENVIGIRLEHFKGRNDNSPAFKLHKSNVKVIIKETDNQIIFTSGLSKAVINKENKFKIAFYYNDIFLTESNCDTLVYARNIKTNKNYMVGGTSLGIGEKVYGLGERFSPLVKNGQVVNMWNSDPGTTSNQSYINVPFFVTNKNYGVFVNSTDKVSFEVASENVNRVEFSIEDQKLEYFVIGGENPKDVLNNYTNLSGKPSLPAKESFGLWLSTSFLTDYNEETINKFIDGMKARDIPLHTFHFDCYWMKGVEWCNFHWDEDNFPDPKGMLQRLKQKGIDSCVWINPYIAQKSSLFEEGYKNGYFLKDKNGHVYQTNYWQPGLAYVDFTNPDACNWYSSYLEKLMDMGVRYFKTDFGELIPEDAVYFNKAHSRKMHNFYTYLYNKTVYESMENKLGKGKGLLFARSGTAGSQSFPVHWGGDCLANFSGMAETLRAGLSLGASGFGFWSHDISGFGDTAPPYLYKRWSAFGLLSSHSRLHGAKSYRVPWNFDEESVDVLRFFTKLKCTLMPYIYYTSHQAHKYGIPVLRAMVLEFNNDPLCDYLDTQYMLGESLLVAPIFNEENLAKYYLPKGSWTHLLDNRIVKGGSWIEEEYNFQSLPLFVKENTLLAIGSDEYNVVYDYDKNLTLHLFSLQNNKIASTTIYTDETNGFKISMERHDNSINVINSLTNESTLILRNIESIKDITNNLVYNSTDLGISIKIPANLKNFTIYLD